MRPGKSKMHGGCLLKEGRKEGRKGKSKMERESREKRSRKEGAGRRGG